MQSSELIQVKIDHLIHELSCSANELNQLQQQISIHDLPLIESSFQKIDGLLTCIRSSNV